MNSRKLLIRAQANPVLGTRSVHRALTLAQAWAEQGGQSYLAAEPLPLALQRHIEDAGHAYLEINDTKTPWCQENCLAQWSRSISPDWLVLDGPKFQAPSKLPNPLKALGASGTPMIRVGQSGTLDFLNSGVVSPQRGPNMVRLPELSASPLDFVLTWETRRLPTRKIIHRARRILVDFSETNPDVWSFQILKTLSQMDHGELVVDCLSGANTIDLHRINQLKQKSRLNLRVHRNADRLMPLLQNSDLAVTSAGATSVELARNGIPGIVVPTNEEQHRMAQILHDAGAVLSLFSDSDATESIPARLYTVLKRFLKNRDQRRQMALNGPQLVDGLGATRLAQRMIGSSETFLRRSA